MNRLGFLPSPLTLGTVQLGTAYGIANRHGMPSAAEAEDILDLAWRGKVNTLDTARAYGQSEAMIGRWRVARGVPQVRVVSKVPPVSPGPTEERRAFVRAQLALSLAALQTDKLDILMLHKGDDLLDPVIARELQDLKTAGKIGAFGISIYDPQIALRVLDQIPLAAMQIPASLVDKRFERAGVLEHAQKNGVTVFVRSAFLQGALLMQTDALPRHLAALRSSIHAIRQLSAETGRPVTEILLVAARDIAGANSIVVGVERAAQLEPHLAAIASPALSANERKWLEECVNDIPDATVDPSRWPS